MASESRNICQNNIIEDIIMKNIDAHFLEQKGQKDNVCKVDYDIDEKQSEANSEDFFKPQTDNQDETLNLDKADTLPESNPNVNDEQDIKSNNITKTNIDNKDEDIE